MAYLCGESLCAEVAICMLFAAKIDATFCSLAAMNVKVAFEKNTNKRNRTHDQTRLPLVQTRS